MSESKTARAALNLIGKLREVAPAFDAINRQSFALFGDFSPHVTPIAEVVYGEVRELIRSAFGEYADTVDYFIDECAVMKDGGIIREADGTEWRLRTVDDLRAYLNKERQDAN